MEVLDIIINFIKDNYWWIVPIFIAVVQSIFLLIFKRRPIIKDTSYYRDLMLLINEAENYYGSGHGDEKLDFVLNKFITLKDLDNSEWMKSSIKNVVEMILSIPSKKKGG